MLFLFIVNAFYSENNALSDDKCTNAHKSDVNMKNDIKQIENLQVDA